MKLGRFKQAQQCFKKALKVNSQAVPIHNNLGIALKSTGDYERAVLCFRRALNIDPNYGEAYANLANTFKQIGNLTEASSNYEQAIRLNPNSAKMHNQLGLIYYDSADYAKAISSFKYALENAPDFAEAYNNLGNAIQTQSTLEKAATYYEKALDIKPDYAEAYKNYTAIVKFKENNNYTNQIPKLLSSNTISDKDRMYLSLALAKVKFDLNEVDEAFELLHAAKALRKRELGYDISLDLDWFKGIKSAFDILELNPNKSLNDKQPDTTPIFIVGMPRSGTSLVEQIISSHSNVIGLGELPYLNDELVKEEWKTSGVTPKYLEKLRSEYYQKVDERGIQEPYFTDKLPSNFMWIGFIIEAFPTASIIHIKRNPMAVCWSNYKLFFPSNGHGQSNDMEDIAHYYQLYENIMQYWHRRYPNRIHDIQYETLTENQEFETKKLLEYIGLEWEGAVLDFHKSSRSVNTLSSAQVRNKMYTGSSEEWLKYKDYLEPMSKILPPTQ